MSNTRVRSGYISEIFSSFQGEGPFLGERHIFVRFLGCSLGCGYCDTPYAATEAGPARMDEAGGGVKCLENPLSVRTVMDAVISQEVFPGLNSKLAVTGGEPLEQPEFLRALLEGLDGRFKTLIETNGILPDALVRVKDLADIISMDFKLPSVTGKGELWDAHREFALAAKGRELVAKAVVSRQTPPGEVETAANILAETAPDALFVIQPLSLPPGSLTARTHRQEPVPPPPLAGEGNMVESIVGGEGDYLLDFYFLAKRILRNVRVIPQVHKIMGVR